ncbi:NAD(P)H-binding protein [Streptomonospora wellingtoniae]|uniref:NAD(P)H-binding protein n=1 Tax=Streptomonospora wellingtoniae TaxID=3075544 RepID=A0ABU2KP95_9ACTN|nr:NAD(P)H-binding protein [Streptomonospora sp. DSM 45055]MDT0301086.1 NAD(P)H-binding protein [Streptomonospora sp. DSM 45055]
MGKYGDYQASTHMIGITGATGALGRRVAERLAQRGASQRLIVRDLNRAPDLPGASAAMAAYEDIDAFERAARGVDTLLLIPAPASDDRVERHLGAVDAALAAGVGRIVYVSFLSAGPASVCAAARDHFYTEARIRASGVRHTFLRPGLYLDLLPSWVDSAGLIRGPAGQGRLAWVSREDAAEAAVAVLTGGTGHDGRTYDLTGPEAVGLGETARRLSALTGRTIAYAPESVPTAGGRLRVGESWAGGGACAAIAAGELDVVSPSVPELIGRRAQSIEGYLRTRPSALHHAPV